MHGLFFARFVFARFARFVNLFINNKPCKPHEQHTPRAKKNQLPQDRHSGSSREQLLVGEGR